MIKVKCKPSTLDWRGRKFVSGREVELTSPADIAAARLCPDLTITFERLPLPTPPESGAEEPSFPGFEAPTPESPAEVVKTIAPAGEVVVPSSPVAAPEAPVRRGPGRPPKAK